MKVTINGLEYLVENDDRDIILIPVVNDDHSLILKDGYNDCWWEAFYQDKTNRYNLVEELAKELLVEYVIENEKELKRIEP